MAKWAHDCRGCHAAAQRPTSAFGKGENGTDVEGFETAKGCRGAVEDDRVSERASALVQHFGFQFHVKVAREIERRCRLPKVD
jgi:hypothetical protein